MQDPKIALDSILENDKQFENLTVHTLTIARYALLELLNSPFIDPNIKFSLNNIIPSIYVMCEDIDKLSIYNSKNLDLLKKDAIIFSEKLNPDLLKNIIKEIISKVYTMLKITPEDIQDSTNKKK